MDNLYSLFKTSLFDLLKNKIRTLLTSFGILIGVFAVVLLIAFGEGLRNFVLQQLEDLGSNVVYVYPGNILEGSARPGGGLLGGAKFDDKDLTTLQKIKEIKYVVPTFVKRSMILADGEQKLTDVYVTTPQIFVLRNLQIKTGRLFTEADLNKNNKVVVLGPKIAKELFGSLYAALGKQVRIAEQRFEVIGIVSEQGGASLGGPDFDSYSYIPKTAAGALNPDKQIFSFYLQAFSDQDIVKVKQEAEKKLLKRYDSEDFTVAEPTQFLEIIDSVLGVMNSVLLAVGSISLIVGGVGIMNIMYASANDRIKEVGIRRAIGATRKDILVLFLSEAVILSFIGGVSGLLFAWSVVLIIQPWFPASINLLSVIVALGVSGAIGIFFGVFPAIQAAKRSPIDAIKYE